MCVSLGPASFSRTILYAGEVSALSVHVLGYQNSVQNGQHALARIVKRLGRGPTGNAMLLHFPAAEPMAEANMLDTRDCPQILQDMARALAPPPRADNHPALGARSAGMADVLVFTRGIYDVVLARDARYIPQALERVRPDKRPPIAEAIFRAYSDWFPEWPVALCCFNNLERARAEPLLWWYRPRNPAALFAPALDAHDGRPPDLDGHVAADHTVILGSDRLTGGFPVHYIDRVSDPDAKPNFPRNLEAEAWAASRREAWAARHPEQAAALAHEGRLRQREWRAKWERQQAIWPYLPERVDGRPFSGRSVNGDFACRVSDLLAGDPIIGRLQPRQLVELVG